MVSRKPRKSLLVVNQYYYPDTASTGQLLTELCEALSENFDVTALVGTPSYSVDSRSKKDEKSKSSKVNLVRVFNTKFKRTNFIGRLLNYFSFMLSAALRGIFIKKHDLIVVMSDPPTVNFIGFIFKILKRSKLIQICQDVYPEVAKQLKKADNPLLLKSFSFMNRKAQASCDGIVAISEGMREILAKKGLPLEKIEVIENWIDTDLVTPQDKKNKIYKELNIPDKFIVMHSGNIGLSQELDVLIDAAEVLENNRDIIFIIIGDGALKARLVNIVKEKKLANVLFFPYREKSDLKYSLSMADVHFLSLKEGLKGLIVPSKIYGIMAAARPVIACMEEGDDLLKLIDKHQIGYKAFRDPNSVANGILYFYNNRNLIGEYGKRARLAVERYNSKSAIINRYIDYFSGFIS